MPAKGPRKEGQARGRYRRGKPAALVLIVDDTPDARDVYATYFTHMGLRVVTAPDGETGIAAAVHYRPNVIVMDLAMPRVDGITAMKHLKRDARTRDVPVILLTGYPYKAIEDGALEAGAAVFLTKPCLPEDLAHHVARLAA